MNVKKYLAGSATGVLMLALSVVSVLADSANVDFEGYSLGSISGQDGWSNAVNPAYDQAVVANTYGYSSFGLKSLRISDAVTSGSFGDWIFAKPLTDSVGETGATSGSFSSGTKQTHFETQFDIASTQLTQQPGMHVSVSPDRGDGSRMSYLRFEDGVSGMNVFFDDVQGTTNPANFVETQIGTDLSRSVPHTIKLTMDVVDGPSNDVVKVWIDGNLVITGTSWENYYRFDSEASAEQSPRIVKTVIIQARGSANPANLGNGYLFDNLTLASSTSQAPSVPVITTPANNATVTTSALTKIDWTDSTGGTNPPFEYMYEAFNDAGYTTSIYTSAWLSVSEIPTPGTSPGVYYVRVKARNALGDETAWSNDALNPYKITVIADGPVLVGPPTDKNQCKRNGWRVFNNPTFNNQGQCEKYVKDHRDDGKAEGDLRLINPNQRIKFKLSEKDVSNSNHHKFRHNYVEYWNYEYPGVLHYKANVICTEVDEITKEARFVFQIPEGWPGLTGLYVVAYVKDIKQKGVADLYGHAATADLATATAWCDTGTGFVPAMYSVVKGKVEVK